MGPAFAEDFVARGCLALAGPSEQAGLDALADPAFPVESSAQEYRAWADRCEQVDPAAEEGLASEEGLSGRDRSVRADRCASEDPIADAGRLCPRLGRG